MINFKNHIIFDNIESWPSEIIDIIKNNENLLKEFLKKESHIDKLAIEDVMLRYNRPENIYRKQWDIIINEIDNMLEQYSIVGIHCTKLLDWEIEDIKQNGLKPLSKTCIKNKIEKAFKQNFLSIRLKDKLINKKEVNEDNRKGNIYVFHCLENLRDERGLNRLFGLWGGESLYSYIKDNQELKNIGTPCIAFTSIKINEINFNPELSKRIIAIYFNDNYFDHDTDSVIKTDLKVLRIVKRNEKLFQDLTGIENWDNKIY
ncbi:hypothetical protein [Tenacibaculum finnmarkense]|uniref:hypothetical protein n=1 Tax=Tenacibaculum finnmarkense TaxID=2781243 RepID=UPI00187B2615|nr:hypothetical protein [Tenacibaculum finnmarkense]MBE7646139.1 hypothetical protein [Tenacibaculum finnmarkense genomovar ulcerans]MCG8750046.1 hypothetical protein [Tenacibaculum finnmarkense]MCG8796264.1 hypothetical protein [Tenacibaculum finnmarkense]MCG8798594.1 hypothetical protein [Tenacibaculum finnmarkense]